MNCHAENTSFVLFVNLKNHFSKMSVPMKKITVWSQTRMGLFSDNITQLLGVYCMNVIVLSCQLPVIEGILQGPRHNYVSETGLKWLSLFVVTGTFTSVCATVWYILACTSVQTCKYDTEWWMSSLIWEKNFVLGVPRLRPESKTTGGNDEMPLSAW